MGGNEVLMQSVIRPLYIQRHPIYNDKYIIVLDPDFELFKDRLLNIYIIIARLLNLSYPNCLRYLRDQYGAQLIGKYQTSIDVLFDKSEELNALIRLLNTRLLLLEDEWKSPYIFKREEDGSITRTDFDNNNETNSGTFKAI